MYRDYWQLTEKPFEPQPAGGRGMSCEVYEAARLRLRYAIEGRREVAVVAGPSGVGKTFLVEQLAYELAQDSAHEPTHVVQLRFPQLTPRELLAWIACELGHAAPPGEIESSDRSLRAIEALLVQRATDGGHTVLVVDEAHLLEDTGLLETLRLLTNLTLDGQTLATLLLVGQPEVVSIVSRYPSLAQRVAQLALIKPLGKLETHDYVQHRLQVAGARQQIFSADAIEALHLHAQGLPRQINRLADLALVVGFAEGAPHVTGDLIASVASELTLLRAA